jgi:hypothetical protein
MEGFGSDVHRRFGRYSLLHVDVKIFWQLVRLLYSYPRLVGMRHDLFLLFGFWHAYHYAHVALWNDFRHTFLGPVFFALYPDHKLMQRPKLTQSSTLFTWMRLAYPSIKSKLVAAIVELKQRLLSWQVQYANEIVSGTRMETAVNPHLASYIHLTNLHMLFEFCIPCIQDYGCALKGNDWEAFFQSFNRMVVFFGCCMSRGASDYYKSMLVFHHLLRYWIKMELPVMELLRVNHTIFSEESGEIALSVLVHSQPPSNRAQIDQTRKYWHLTHQRYLALRSGEDLPRVKKHRIVGNTHPFTHH